eukprot:7193919-Prymnesium_polylepis.2
MSEIPTASLAKAASIFGTIGARKLCGITKTSLRPTHERAAHAHACVRRRRGSPMQPPALRGTMQPPALR